MVTEHTRVAVVMDPISDIQTAKDTTLAMLLAVSRLILFVF